MTTDFLHKINWDFIDSYTTYEVKFLFKSWLMVKAIIKESKVVYFIFMGGSDTSSVKYFLLSMKFISEILLQILTF